MANNKHFEQGGANYAHSRPTYPNSLAVELGNLCAQKSHAVDIGCGTGQFLDYIETWSAKRKAEEAGERALFDAYAEELASTWPDDQTHKIRWPIATRITRIAGT